MGTTLTGTTPQDTYDSLIKVTDNGPLSGTAKFLSDGLGNDSVLALSTTALGIGTASPTSLAQLNGTAGTTHLRISEAGTTIGFVGGANGVITSATGSMAIRAEAGLILSSQGNAQTMTLTSTGNVGIGTSAPNYSLQVNSSTTTTRLQLTNSTTGTGASNGLQIIQDGVNTTFSQKPNGFMSFETNNVERFAITANGVTFNGDTAAANALDDYEEGTFTATLKGSVSDPTTPVTTTGTYTKIGRQVTINVLFSGVNTLGASGDVSVTGAPFASSIQSTGSVMLFNFDLDTSTAQNCYIGTGTIVEFYGQKDDAAWVTLKHNAGSARYLIFTITYFV